MTKDAENDAARLKEMLSALAGLEARVTASPLDESGRRNISARSHRCPDALVHYVADLADQFGGRIAGMSFDAQTARDGLESLKRVKVAADAARRLARRLDDERIQSHADITNPAFAIFLALERVVKTPEGAALKKAYEDMREIVRNRPPRTNRRRRAGTGAGQGDDGSEGH